MYLIWRASEAIRGLADRQRNERSLPLAKYVVLTFVRDRSDMTSADLARIIGNSPQTINEVISSLERSGLIERRTSAANRKSKFVAITDSGLQALAQTEQTMDLVEEQAFRSMSKDDLDTFRNLLRGILEAAH
jgi:DNA-binding MarR family transcriptional regulator